MTATTLARRFGLSRSTLLYYESIGLLRRPPRTGGNYRAFSDQDAARLEQICMYRKLGLSLAAIRTVLDRPGSGASAVLQRRLADIETEVDALRGHQHDILRLLQRSRSFRRNQMITKDTWVAIMKASGFSDADMHRWHAEFEKAAPAEHEEFLEFLHIPAAEIAKIREWSRKHPAR